MNGVVKDIVWCVIFLLAAALAMAGLQWLGVVHIIGWNTGPACAVCGAS